MAQIVPWRYAIYYPKMVEIGKYIFKPPDTENVEVCAYIWLFTENVGRATFSGSNVPLWQKKVKLGKYFP